MKLHPNELWLFYDCNADNHKKTRALAYSITKHVNEFDLKHCRITQMTWSDILEMMQMRPKDLLNRSSPKYQAELAGHDFDDNDWLNILVNNPCLLKAPIAVMHDMAVLCVNPKDILKLSTQKESEKA